MSGAKKKNAGRLYVIMNTKSLMRYRMNILDLAKRGMFYDEIVEPVFAKGGAWEIC